MTELQLCRLKYNTMYICICTDMCKLNVLRDRGMAGYRGKGEVYT